MRRRLKRILPTGILSVDNKAGANTPKAKIGLFLYMKALLRMIVKISSYINHHKHRNIMVGSALLLTLFLISWNTELMPESNEPLIFDEDGKFVAAPPAPLH